jgi:hypothetical protein
MYWNVFSERDSLKFPEQDLVNNKSAYIWKVSETQSVEELQLCLNVIWIWYVLQFHRHKIIIVIMTGITWVILVSSLTGDFEFSKHHCAELKKIVIYS